MKRFSIVVLLLLTAITVVSAQSTKFKKDPVGKWLFEAPYAPEGYTAGVIEVAIAQKKYSATMAFSGNETKMPADRVRFENDTLTFGIFVEGQDVSITLKFDEAAKMSGKAVYSEGTVPLLLTKETKK